jgi:hypothetical protein
VKRALFHPLADDEFAAAVAYYAQRAQGLGDRFYETIRRITAEIEAAPQRYRPWRHGTRRHFHRRFPYAVIYLERPTHLWVVAVAPFKRRPDYWLGRLG